jgi:leader peptidase (prepilin peptidase)/N-methyltransferase
MNIIIYITILFIGVVFGSFYTLAVYRIPKKEDITHVRSYCPNCNHKLKFLDLIPVLSYIFLGGKCRYCKKKIRIRYLLLEVFSGLVFILIALSKGITFESSLIDLIDLTFIYLFITGAFIIAGIDKEKKVIPDGLIIYELVIDALYMIFKNYYHLDLFYNIVGFLAIPLLLFIINLTINLLYKDENKLPFGMGDIKYIAVIGLFLGLGRQLIIIVGSILLISIYYLLKFLLGKKNDKEIPFGFYITLALMITIILNSYLSNIINIIEI